MSIPSLYARCDKRPLASVLVLFFALVGMLVTGANLHAGSLANDYKFNKNDPAPILLAASGSSFALVVEDKKGNHTFDTPAAQGFSDIKPDWRLAGLVTSADTSALPPPDDFHLRPPLRAPPL